MLEESGISFDDGSFVGRLKSDPDYHNLMVVEPGGSYVIVENLNVSQNVLFSISEELGMRIEGGLDTDIGAVLITEAVPVDQPLYSAHPLIQFVRARQGSDGAWSFDVTVTYPDTGWEDYADGWHVETTDGEILGTRILLHPHVGEQPFPRGLSGVTIPEDVTEVVVRSHNLISGYAPEVVTVQIGESGSGDAYEVERK